MVKLTALLREKSEAVNAAAEAAVELVRGYSQIDPYGDDDGKAGDGNGGGSSSSSSPNPWKDPRKMFASLDAAREVLKAAWADLEVAVRLEEEREAKDERGEFAEADADDFDANDGRLKVAYVDMATEAFADVLDGLRNEEGDDLDVDVLVDCLQSGLDLMSRDERALFLRGLSQREDSFGSDGGDAGDEDEDKDDGGGGAKLTPHEKRRRELGFHVETTTAPAAAS